MKRKFYTLKACEDLIGQCMNMGYETETLWEGTLGLGRIILLSPDNRHWNFEIAEHYESCWSSIHSIRRFRKLSKALAKEIEKARENEND